MNRINLILIILMCFSLGTNAQNERIKLSNPSFEDMPRHSQPPMGWYNCGMEGESPPDVQPGAFEVNQRAKDGMTYLGLVTRDNETWEAVGQRLSSPMKSGACYQFRIYLSYSDEYFSISRTTLKNEFFIKPVLLRIWGGNGYCDKRELLAESEVVKSITWEEHTFDMKPKRDYKYIVLEAFYKTPTLFPYNGNLLVDHASDIIEKELCDTPIDDELFDEPKDVPEPPMAVVDTPPKDETTPIDNIDQGPGPVADPVVNIDPIDPNPVVNNNDPVVIKEMPKIMAELDPETIKEGQTIRINQLDFKADDYRILKGMYPVLDEIYTFMVENPKVIVEIGGHTNRLPSHDYCNWLSKNRASAVRDHLVSKGLSKDRIAFKGYGKTEPVDISNTLAGRRKNQRVEIKILSLKG